MCHPSCIIFGAKNLTREEVAGKRVIEVGSYDMNGTLRPLIEAWRPREYIGVDIVRGSGVDIVCNAENVAERFGREAFDVVISTELIEHVRDWRKVISNLKNVCRSNGIILVTTRSYGYGFHAAPYDFWRYEPDDMNVIFSDCAILALERDHPRPGVFIKARRPANFVEKDLSSYSLYSMIVNRRVLDVTNEDFRNPHFIREFWKWRIRGRIVDLVTWFFARL